MLNILPVVGLGDNRISTEETCEQLLRQTEQGYAEIGAPKHAQRLAARHGTHYSAPAHGKL